MKSGELTANGKHVRVHFGFQSIMFRFDRVRFDRRIENEDVIDLPAFLTALLRKNKKGKRARLET